MPSRFGNAFMSWMIRSPFWGLMGSGMAVITVKGRKSGRAISTPINVMQEGQTYTVISSHDRIWWKNLRGGAQADLRVSGRDVKVTGELIEAEAEVKNGMVALFDKQPVVAKYLKVRMGAGGTYNEEDLSRLAGERVIIRLTQASE